MHLTANELPDDCQTTLRDRWEYLHAILTCLLTASVAQAR